MDEMSAVAVIIPLLAGVMAGIGSILTWVKIAHALRAKHRLNYLLKKEAMRDSSVSALLREVSTSVNLSEGERERLIAIIENKIRVLPKEDQSLIEEGLRQGSREGVRRYLKEIAAA